MVGSQTLLVLSPQNVQISMDRMSATRQEPEGSEKSQSTSAVAVDEDSPACQSCRRRKLKCSREAPKCSQCSRLEILCVYPSIRHKPGMKSGAVEALSRRLQVLEDIVFHGDGQKIYQPRDQGPQSFVQVSMALAKALQSISASIKLRESSISPDPESSASRKRKRNQPNRTPLSEQVDEDDPLSSLPSQLILDLVVQTYFQTVHHWIPFLHPSRTKLRLSDQPKKRALAIILHAMVCSTLKLLNGKDLGLERVDIEHQIKHSRQTVLLTAMSSPSTEHLQALVILSFDYIGSGEVAKAWSLVGSLTRTVEYLRLTVEPEEVQQYPLRKPLTLLADANDWTEVEERRRLFWNIFALDRFCSITTGWSTSLTSDDVHRRLPCDGGLWHREETSETPFFGIWNKSAARIGNSIAFIPDHYPTPDQELIHKNIQSPRAVPNSTVDTSKLGAFAYCIEATESLSQVTTFFLQQKVDFQNRQEVRNWLTRFKELDLRLVHWKMFLPQKWKDSDISSDITSIDMDPNLTLAHITHNTSMLLLHQHIAYPPPHWNDFVKLPSACSAETCQLAAVETASIAQKYLKHTKIAILSSQFALCAFIAGRILLVHWRFYETKLSSDFFVIVECLREMSKRWQGYQWSTSELASATDLANQYANQLESFHAAFIQRPGFCQEVLGYSRNKSNVSVDSLLPMFTREVSHMGPRSPLQPSISSHAQTEAHSPDKRPWKQPTVSMNKNSLYNAQNHSPQLQNYTMNPPSLHSPRSWQTPRMSYATPQETTNFRKPAAGTTLSSNYDSARDDELTAVSNMLLGQQFLEMDRVITFDGTNFALEMSGWQNGHEI